MLLYLLADESGCIFEMAFLGRSGAFVIRNRPLAAITVSLLTCVATQRSGPDLPPDSPSPSKQELFIVGKAVC